MRQAVIHLTICSPHSIVNETLTKVFARQPDFKVIGSTAMPANALSNATQSDIVLIHFAFPRTVVHNLSRAISSHSSARVIILGTPHDESDLLRLIEHGSRGYVPRGRPFVEWLHVVRTVAAEGAWIEPALAWALLKRHRELQQLVTSGYTAIEMRRRSTGEG
jgi:DNA-binding NarL/FixJ family response regulator